MGSLDITPMMHVCNTDDTSSITPMIRRDHANVVWWSNAELLKIAKRRRTWTALGWEQADDCKLIKLS